MGVTEGWPPHCGEGGQHRVDERQGEGGQIRPSEAGGAVVVG